MSELSYDLSCLNRKFNCDEIDKGIVKRRMYGEEINIKIDTKDFLNRLDILKGYSFNEFWLSKKEKYCEHPVRINKTDIFFKLPHEYFSENMKFRINTPTDNYSMYLFLSKGLNSWYAQVLDHIIYKLAQESEIRFQDYLKIIIDKVLKLKTVVIESSSILDKKDFLTLSNSYFFYLAYTKNWDISLRKNPLDVYNPVIYDNHYFTGKNIIGQNLIEELIDYYKRGVASEDPFIQFISFYHVIEYSFEIVIKEFKSPVILIPKGFKENEEEIKFFINQNLGDGKKLFLVLLKYIELNELKKQLNNVSTNYFDNLTKHSVKFADAKPIEEKNFYETLTNRIYVIRNALVHRKENHKLKYLPFNIEHREELKKEIPIIRAIATQIILKLANRT